jgi:hypothetical protein
MNMKITEATKEYFELKAEAKRIEERLSELRPVLENHIKVTTGTLTGENNAAVTIEVGEYGLNLSPAKRDNFNHKLALAELGDVVKPYLTQTWYTILKVTRVLKQSEVA